jgi:hypothetical protein
MPIIPSRITSSTPCGIPVKPGASSNAVGMSASTRGSLDSTTSAWSSGSTVQLYSTFAPLCSKVVQAARRHPRPRFRGPLLTRHRCCMADDPTSGFRFPPPSSGHFCSRLSRRLYTLAGGRYLRAPFGRSRRSFQPATRGAAITAVCSVRQFVPFKTRLSDPEYLTLLPASPCGDSF